MLRRFVALLLLLGAGVLAIAKERTPGPGIATLALTRDLPTGATLRAADLTVLRVTTAPDGALHSTEQATGHSLTGPARRGEILTDARLVPQSGPDPGTGRVAVPIRPADAGTVELLNPGVHVAVIAVHDDGSGSTLTNDAVVLALPPPGTDRTAPAGRLVVVAVPTAIADKLAAAALSGDLALRFT